MLLSLVIAIVAVYTLVLPLSDCCYRRYICCCHFSPPGCCCCCANTPYHINYVVAMLLTESRAFQRLGLAFCRHIAMLRLLIVAATRLWARYGVSWLLNLPYVICHAAPRHVKAGHAIITVVCRWSSCRSLPRRAALLRSAVQHIIITTSWRGWHAGRLLVAVTMPCPCQRQQHWLFNINFIIIGVFRKSCCYITPDAATVMSSRRRHTYLRLLSARWFHIYYIIYQSAGGAPTYRRRRTFHRRSYARAHISQWTWLPVTGHISPSCRRQRHH